MDPTSDDRLVTYIFTQEQLAAIGSVAVESTACEELVEKLIWQLAGLTGEHGTFFTDRMQMQNRLDLLRDLAKPVLNAQQAAELTALISNLKEANVDRNTVVHGSWKPTAPYLRILLDGPENHPPATAYKRRLRSDPITKSATEILEVARRIGKLTIKLLDFAQATWPDPPQQESPEEP